MFNSTNLSKIWLTASRTGSSKKII
uniref:Uncharacterized protein n=1 Tax=Rhizophora mucronata TaxID=61149 RepID=A0A2P2P719_RHIMU